MIIKFLGTGAADWSSRHADMPERRRYTSTLIDERLLIDQTELIKDSLSEIQGVDALIYTHSHRDHFDIDFQKTIAPKAVYAEKSWAADANAEPITPYVPFEAAGFEILPLPANHSTPRLSEQPLIYLIKGNGKTLLYATDGAWLLNGAYHAILSHKPLDAAVFDGTVGDAFPNDWRVFEHNTLPMVRTMRRSLIDMNALKPDAKVFVTHLARTLHPSQTELEENEKRLGGELIICRDGMTAVI